MNESKIKAEILGACVKHIQQQFQMDDATACTEPDFRFQKADHLEPTSRKGATSTIPDDFSDMEEYIYAWIENLTPIECPLIPEKSHTWSLIRRPSREEPFTLVGNPIEIQCVKIGMQDLRGNDNGDAYFPIDQIYREELDVPTVILALHPAVSYPDKRFIFPEPRERRRSRRNDLDLSLSTALCDAPGNWIQLWYNDESESFQYAAGEQEPDETPTYPGFVWDCLAALSDCFHSEPINSLDLFIDEQRKLHMCQ